MGTIIPNPDQLARIMAQVHKNASDISGKVSKADIDNSYTGGTARVASAESVKNLKGDVDDKIDIADIDTDFSGGEGKVAGADEAKDLNEKVALSDLGSEVESYHRGVVSNNQIFTPRGAISIHFDDIMASDYTLAYPALLSRHLVAGFAVVEDWIGVSGYCSIGQLMEMQTNGMEMMHHTKTHQTAEEAIGLSDYIEITYNSVDRLREQGLNMQSLVVPGTFRGTDNPMVFDSEEKLKSDYAQVVRRTYRSTFDRLQQDNGSAVHNLPVFYPWGLQTGGGIEGFPLSTLISSVDYAVTYGGAHSMTCHSFHLGEEGYLSVADFETFLDYLATKQSEGLIQVLTPSGMVFCQTGTPRNQVYDSGFENCTTESPGWWQLTGGTTIATDGGHTGNNYARIPHGGELMASLRVGGYRTLLIKFWAKAPTSSARVIFGAHKVNVPQNFFLSLGDGISDINPVPIAGGSGYAVGDLLVLTGCNRAAVRVMAVDGSGCVTEVCLMHSGLACTIGTKATTGGTGSGCTVEVTAIYGNTFQGNTLTVDTTWTQYVFTIGIHDTANLQLEFYTSSALDGVLYVDDFEIYLL